MSNYTTGEMAKLCNVSVRTVQYYDHKGVLHPSSESEGGRRIYSDDDLTKLRLICTLKSIGLSLDSIKSIMESELSEKILTILLDEQLKTLNSEIDERKKQIEMIAAIKENFVGKATVPANTILDVERIMKNKNQTQGRKRLYRFYIAAAFAIPLALAGLIWLVVMQVWWAIVIFAGGFVLGISVALYILKGTEFICPNCDEAFKLPLLRAFFTTGDHKVRWMTCPECGETNWCVMRWQKAVENSAD
ncbi:MAG: MerR family transcriptional regulator [Defluviitaleaceae bacterium]|nr:MerR family transcriptional regulator [Defluviitaleaceae bacterium]